MSNWWGIIGCGQNGELKRSLKSQPCVLGKYSVTHIIHVLPIYATVIVPFDIVSTTYYLIKAIIDYGIVHLTLWGPGHLMGKASVYIYIESIFQRLLMLNPLNHHTPQNL